jgi:hypothetical protein
MATLPFLGTNLTLLVAVMEDHSRPNFFTASSMGKKKTMIVSWSAKICDLTNAFRFESFDPVR